MEIHQIDQRIEELPSINSVNQPLILEEEENEFNDSLDFVGFDKIRKSNYLSCFVLAQLQHSIDMSKTVLRKMNSINDENPNRSPLSSNDRSFSFPFIAYLTLQNNLLFKVLQI